MQNNKVILEHCPNFDKIVNGEFLEDDVLSLRLVKIYRDYIFSVDITDEEALENAQMLDKILGKYVDDYFFRKTLQIEIKHMKVKKSNDATKTVVEAIIKIYKQYKFDQTRKIYISRWI